MSRYKSKSDPTGWEIGLGITTVLFGGALFFNNVINNWSKEARATQAAERFQLTKEILARADTDTLRFQHTTTGPKTHITENTLQVRHFLTDAELQAMGVVLPQAPSPQPR